MPQTPVSSSGPSELVALPSPPHKADRNRRIAIGAILEHSRLIWLFWVVLKVGFQPDQLGSGTKIELELQQDDVAVGQLTERHLAAEK